jgi:hypothetical protein
MPLSFWRCRAIDQRITHPCYQEEASKAPCHRKWQRPAVVKIRNKTDARDPMRVEHSVLDLVRQRLVGLALGYEDLDDHADLRRDPLLATAAGKVDVLGVPRHFPNVQPPVALRTGGYGFSSLSIKADSIW